MRQPLLEQPAVGEPGQAVVGREIEQLPGTLVEQVPAAAAGRPPRSRSTPAAPATATSRSARPRRMHTGSGTTGTPGAAACRRTRALRLPSSGGPTARKMMRGPLARSRASAGVDARAARSARAPVSPASSSSCWTWRASSRFAADGQHGERLTRRQRRHAAEVGAEQGGRMDRHAEVRRVCTWIQP